MHQPPCEPLEEVKLELARTQTILRGSGFPSANAKRWKRLAIIIPVVVTILGSAGAWVTAAINGSISNKIQTVAKETSRQTCQDLIVSQSASFMMGVQTGHAQAEAEAAQKKLENPLPLGMTVSHKTQTKALH